MKTLLLLAVFLMPCAAFALSESAIEYCFTTNAPKACMLTMSAEVQQRQIETQRELMAQQLQAQMQLARIQANGLMLFGSGPALINGMNQGLHQMYQPYVETPQFHHSH